MIKDRGQKERIYKHFRALGWMAQIEVPVTISTGVSRRRPPVTDIDVLGLREAHDLRWEYVVGDCKTRKKESPVNRALWAFGLIRAVQGSSGFVLLKREKNLPIERDHKLLADGENVVLVEDSAFEAYDRAVIYPAGSVAFPESIDTIEDLRGNIRQRFQALESFSSWIISDAWGNTNHSDLLRRCLGKAREVSGEIDPTQREQVALALELAAAFSVPFASLVGTVFRRHLIPSSRETLEEAVRVIIWGGREQYNFYVQVRSRLAEAKGVEKSELALPEWDMFLELLRSILEQPRLAFRIPQLFRSCSLSLVSGAGLETALSAQSDTQLLQISSRVLGYVVKAALWPKEIEDPVRQSLNRRISELANSR